MKTWLPLTLGLALAAAPATQAVVVLSNLSGSAVSFGDFYFGQTLVTPAGGPWDNLSFNFYADVPAATPRAFGGLYLLGQKYGGTPDDLSLLTPGFIAMSTGISGGVWLFDVAVTLQPNTTYYVYTDAKDQISGQAAGPGPNFFSASFGNGTFAEFAASTNFTLEGNVAAVPEPALGAFVGGLLGLGALLRRRRTA